MILFTIFKCFSTKKGRKLCLFQKMRNVLIEVFVFMSFFFGLFLVFELWSILYSTVVNSELGTCERSGRDFCEPDSDANQFRLGSSIQKYAESKGAATVGVWGAKPLTEKKC